MESGAHAFSYHYDRFYVLFAYLNRFLLCDVTLACFCFDRSKKSEVQEERFNLDVCRGQNKSSKEHSDLCTEYASLHSNSTDSGHVRGIEPRKSDVDTNSMDALFLPSKQSRRWRTTPNSKWRIFTF